MADEKVLHRMRYIDWRNEAIKRKLPPIEFQAFVAKLDKSKEITDLQGTKTVRCNWRSGNWAWNDKGLTAIYHAIGPGNYEIVHLDTVKEKGSGFEAKRTLVKEMGKSTDGKLQRRFGKIPVDVELRTQIHEIERCVGPFIGATVKDCILENVYKADYKSAYPAQAIANLPDYHTAVITDEGNIDPSEEWPFIFYLDTHHLAEYKTFDTRKEMFSDMYAKFGGSPRSRIKDKRTQEEIDFSSPQLNVKCLKMKYAKTGISEFKKFFELKEQSPTAEDKQMYKDVMNLSIGTFSCLNYSKESGYTQLTANSKDPDYYGHLRAVILARHNHNMCEVCREIGRKGYKLIMVQTDSIIWQGGPLDCVVQTNNLGDFHEEMAAGRCYIHGCGAYWIEDEAHGHIMKCQGIKNFPKDIETMEDFIGFFTKTKEFEVVGDLKYNKEENYVYREITRYTLKGIFKEIERVD